LPSLARNSRTWNLQKVTADDHDFGESAVSISCVSQDIYEVNDKEEAKNRAAQRRGSLVKRCKKAIYGPAGG